MTASSGRSCQGLKLQDKEYQTSYAMRRPLEARYRYILCINKTVIPFIIQKKDQAMHELKNK